MIGTPTRKTEPHQKCSSRAPPTSGPMAAPTAKLAPQTPIALVRSASIFEHRAEQRQGGRDQRRAGDAEERAGGDQHPALVEKAASAEAGPNAAAPINSSLRRPIRSPRPPTGMSAPASMKP